jgi:signal transduction histidine kinase
MGPVLVSLPAKDVVELLAISAAASAGVTALGVGVLKLTSRRSVRDSAVVVALTPVASVVVAAAAATVAMFISTEQFSVLIALVVFAGGAGIATSLVLATRLMRGSAALRAAAGAVGRGEPYVAPDRTASAELDALARELEVTHAKLDAARRQERSVENSRRELVAWVSHDLRTPLAGIRAMTEALEDNVVSTPHDRALYYERIRLEVDRLAAMVDDLFELSRIHANALNLTLERIDLADVVRDAVATAKPVAMARGLDIETDLRATAVEVDPRAVSRVAGNLIGNAVRYSRTGSALHVSTEADDGAAVLRVRDECGGIAASDMDRLFDVAYRGSAARTPSPDGGAGLGLAIAKGIVAAHGGTIGVENVDGGCEFTVRLPLADAASPVHAPSDQ